MEAKVRTARRPHGRRLLDRADHGPIGLLRFFRRKLGCGEGLCYPSGAVSAGEAPRLPQGGTVDLRLWRWWDSNPRPSACKASNTKRHATQRKRRSVMSGNRIVRVSSTILPQRPIEQGSFIAELLGDSNPTCWLPDSGQPSTTCWRVVSLQLTSGESSSQYAPDGRVRLVGMTGGMTVPPDPSRSIISRFPTVPGYAGCHPRSDNSTAEAQTPDGASRQADPVSSLSRKAQAKPMAVASATHRPPCSKASGNIVSASRARIPPAARARMALTQPGDRPPSRA